MTLAPADEEMQWLRRAREGDKAAFAALYLRYSPGVYTLALRLSGQRSEADDLTQETFLRALQALAGFRAGSPLGPWLKRITANLAIDRLRRIRPSDDIELDALADTHEHSPARALDLLAALQQLSPVWRSVVWLALMEGWSHRELADRYSRTESWSKSILSRALARLKSLSEETL